MQSQDHDRHEILRQIRRERDTLPGYKIVVNAHPAICDMLQREDKKARRGGRDALHAPDRRQARTASTTSSSSTSKGLRVDRGGVDMRRHRRSERREERLTINKEFELVRRVHPGVRDQHLAHRRVRQDARPAADRHRGEPAFTVIMDDIETIEGVGEVVRVRDDPPGMGVVFTRAQPVLAAPDREAADPPRVGRLRGQFRARHLRQRGTRMSCCTGPAVGLPVALASECRAGTVAALDETSAGGLMARDEGAAGGRRWSRSALSGLTTR